MRKGREETMNNEATNRSKTMEKQIACIISNSGIVNVVINGKPYSVAPDHCNYKAVLQAIKDNDNEALVDLVDIPKAVASYTAGKVAIVDGEVQYDGYSIHNSISRRILELMREDMPFKFMVAFLDNLMLNPSHRAVNELYDFLEYANIPLTDDGCFLAYKRVSENYMDKYSGKFDNSVGQVLEMPRNMVDEDKNRTCSSGFHFCSLEYIPHFGSTQDNSTDKVMIVKVNPRDVVAIPADYNNTKGRTCKYEVVAEYEGDWRKDAFTAPVHKKDGTPYYDDREYDEDGYDEDGYDRDGYDADGYDMDGYDEEGYDYDGYDSSGYDRDGYDCDGYDQNGYNEDGYDRNGYDYDGYDKNGLNENGEDRDGNRREYDAKDDDDEDDDEDDNVYCPECGTVIADVTVAGDNYCAGCGWVDDNDSGRNLVKAQRFYGVKNANGQPIRKGDRS